VRAAAGAAGRSVGLELTARATALVTMPDPHPIIDLDSHVADAAEELWAPYVEGELRPRVVADDAGVERVLVAGRLLPKPGGPGRGSPLGVGASDRVFSLDERLAYLERNGIQHALLTPGFVGFAALTTPEEGPRRTLVTAHNRLVFDMARESERIEPVPILCAEDPEWSLGELARCGEQGDVRAVLLRPTTFVARPLRDAGANPLLRHLADAGALLCLHSTTGYYQASPISDLFDDYVFTHSFSHPVEMMVALADLFASGLLGRGLRVAVLEAGCGWLPWLVDRLESHFRHTGGCAPVAASPRELAREALLVGVYPDDKGIPWVIETLGTDVLAFMSDYPHWDAAAPESIAVLSERYGDAVARRILFDNAHRALFGRDPVAQPAASSL
jgi:predicted TIM-barrel fold metal-dependent hydrolase